MEKTIRILAAIGGILSGLGELLRQYNISKNYIKEDVNKAVSEIKETPSTDKQEKS